MTTTKAANITNYDTTPPTIVDSALDGGFIRSIVDTIEVPDNEDADISILARIPVDAVIPSLMLASDDLGNSAQADLGFYKKNSDGTYTAGSAAAIASNLDLNTAAVAFTERRFSVLGIETVQQKAWELAGLSARPAYDYLFVALTFDTGGTAAGTVSIKAQYVA
jgi:hypothetical protein